MSENLEKRVKMTKNKKLFLSLIASVGFIAISLMSPAILKILKSFGVDKKWKRNQKYYFWRSIKTLEKDGLVMICQHEEKEYYTLTGKGRKYISLYGIGQTRKKRWDGKWRILIFDIPEKRREIRERVRNTLIDIGFLKLQNSVWAYPYDCEKIVTLIKADLRIGKELLYLIVEALEGDSLLKNKFKVNF